MTATAPIQFDNPADELEEHGVEFLGLSDGWFNGEVVIQVCFTGPGTKLWVGVADYGDSSELQVVGEDADQDYWGLEGKSFSDFPIHDPNFEIEEVLREAICGLGWQVRNAGIAAARSALVG